MWRKAQNIFFSVRVCVSTRTLYLLKQFICSCTHSKLLHTRLLSHFNICLLNFSRNKQSINNGLNISSCKYCEIAPRNFVSAKEYLPIVPSIQLFWKSSQIVNTVVTLTIQIEKCSMQMFDKRFSTISRRTISNEISMKRVHFVFLWSTLQGLFFCNLEKVSTRKENIELLSSIL